MKARSVPDLTAGLRKDCMPHHTANTFFLEVTGHLLTLQRQASEAKKHPELLCCPGFDDAN